MNLFGRDPRLVAALAMVLLAASWIPLRGQAEETLVQNGVPLTGNAPAAKPLAGVQVIAVVDVDEILQESLAAKSARAQAVKYQQSFQDQVDKEEAALRSTQQSLDQQRKSMSSEVFAEKARAFDATVAESQRKVLSRRQALGRSMNAAMAQVQQAMLEATRQVAVSHGATMVLPRTQVLMFDEKLNITKEIIAIMDKTLTHVDFPVPKIDADQPAGGPVKK